MRRALTLLSLSLMAAGCSRSEMGHSDPADPARMAQLQPEGAVVFAAERGAELVHAGCSEFNLDTTRVSGYWTPSQADILRVEGILSETLRTQLGSHARTSAHTIGIARYYRQYAGVAFGSRRLVYINGFDKAFLSIPGRGGEMDWRHQPVSVCDGGVGLFTAAIDVDTGEVVGFGFNGYA